MFFEHILLIFAPKTDRILWAFGEFFHFSSTLGSCISMTTYPLTKNLGIFSMYSRRSVDCAMFRRHVAKTKFSILTMKI